MGAILINPWDIIEKIKREAETKMKKERRKEARY